MRMVAALSLPRLSPRSKGHSTRSVVVMLAAWPLSELPAVVVLAAGPPSGLPAVVVLAAGLSS